MAVHETCDRLAITVGRMKIKKKKRLLLPLSVRPANGHTRVPTFTVRARRVKTIFFRRKPYDEMRNANELIFFLARRGVIDRLLTSERELRAAVINSEDGTQGRRP